MIQPGERGPGNRYRADFYLFRHFLMGMGTFRDDAVGSHESMKLIFGVNRPFRIRLEGKWHTARAVLLRGGVPHFLNGEGDWQAVLWIDADSSLGLLMEARTLEGRPWTLHGAPGSPSMSEVIQTAGDDDDPAGALHLAELLLEAYGGSVPVPATWDDAMKAVVRRIDADPGSVSIRSLAAESGRSADELHRDFRRVVGADLEDYLHRRKWTVYIAYRQQGMPRQDALRRSGLPGWDGLRDRFTARYGLDLAILETDRPFVRVYAGADEQVQLYL